MPGQWEEFDGSRMADLRGSARTTSSLHRHSGRDDWLNQRARHGVPHLGHTPRSSLVAAYIAVASFGVNYSVALGLTTSGLVAILLSPIWYRHVSDVTFGRRWFLITIGVGVSGLVLFLARPYDIAVSYMSALTITNYAVTASLAGLMTIWALQNVGLRHVVFAYSIGLVFATVLRASTVVDNPWKFGFALPLTLIGLIVLNRALGPLVGPALALLGSGALSAIFDSRSLIGFSLGTLMILLYARSIKHRPLRVPTYLFHATILSLAGIAMYLVTAKLLVGGFFGDQIARRTVMQMYRSSNLLDSGRPEWRISTRLLQDYPLGLGPGATPGFSQRMAGNAALEPLGLSANSNYFSDYVFGGVLKLHSVTFDLWSNFGIAGLAAGLLIGLTVLAALINQILSPRTSALSIYIYLTSMWACFFSPILTSLPIVMFGLSVAIFELTYSATRDKEEVLNASQHSGA